MERTNTEDLAKTVGLPSCGYAQWNKEVNSYQETKQNFQGQAPVYKKVDHAFIKAQDVIYNPITQSYNEPARERAQAAMENQAMTDVLAENKDRSLRYEQTYNILNFQNKLQGLEKREDYPKDKPWYFRPGKDTNVDYNILSNANLRTHHFAAPENRPVEDPPEKLRGKNVKKFGIRDYNVITNRYLEHNEGKTQANKEIALQEASKKYWEFRDFDPIQSQFYDEEKEKTFKATRDEKAKIHGQDEVKKLPLTVQLEGLMYNPLNMHIEAPERLKEKDQREWNKKARYQIRFEAEQATRDECLQEQQRQSEMALRKVSHKRVEEEVNRGFDIINNGKVTGGLAQMDKSEYMKKPINTWTRLQKAQMCNENQNNTITQDQTTGKTGEQAFSLSKTNFSNRTDRMQKASGVVQVPRSQSSNVVAAPASNASSRRATEIRSGGFQRLAEKNIVSN